MPKAQQLWPSKRKIKLNIWHFFNFFFGHLLSSTRFFNFKKTALSLYFSYLHPTFWCSLHFACTLNVLNQANAITCNNWIIIRFITVWLCCHLWKIPCCNLKQCTVNLFLMATSPQAASQLPILEPVSQRMNMCSGTPIFFFLTCDFGTLTAVGLPSWVNFFFCASLSLSTSLLTYWGKWKHFLWNQ